MSDLQLPGLVSVQIPTEFLDRWITMGEGADQIQGIKFEKVGDDQYIMLAVLPDGTGDPVQWPVGHATWVEAGREYEERRRREFHNE